MAQPAVSVDPKTQPNQCVSYRHLFWLGFSDPSLRTTNRGCTRTGVHREEGVPRKKGDVGWWVVPPHVQEVWREIAEFKLSEGKDGIIAQLLSAADDFMLDDAAREVTSDVRAGRENLSHLALKDHLTGQYAKASAKFKKLSTAVIDPAGYRDRLKGLTNQEETLAEIVVGETELRVRYSKKQQRHDRFRLDTLADAAKKLRSLLRDAIETQILPPPAAGMVADSLAKAADALIAALEEPRHSNYWSARRQNALSRMKGAMRAATGNENLEFLSRLLFAFGKTITADTLRG
jgi:hypothetical protein